jgi:hypothetical protein
MSAPIDIVRLKALAEAATRGRWTHDDGFINSKELPRCFAYLAWTGPYSGNEPDSALEQMEANGDWIAAANPAAILAMIERISDLESALAGRQEVIVAKDMRIAQLEADRRQYHTAYLELRNKYDPSGAAPVCTWRRYDDYGTWESSCDELWSFIDGGPKENRVSYCQHCSGKVEISEESK